MLGQRTICPHCRHEVVLPDQPSSDQPSSDQPSSDQPSSDRPFREEVSEDSAVHLVGHSPTPVRPLADQRYYTEQARLQAAYRVPNFSCPFCHTNLPPRSAEKISAAGWITFAVLLTVCLPLCWIGLLITEPERHCSGCGMRLG